LYIILFYGEYVNTFYKNFRNFIFVSSGTINGRN